MEFKATPRTIRDALTLKRKYIIPRFQREYSWGIEELDELWNDLLDNIELEAGKLVTNEYFVGSLVLVGDDDDIQNVERQVVDGQQRLMTFTIAFAVLAQLFAEKQESKLGNMVHQYIIGEDEDGQPYTKVVSETPKPFFQYRIQQKDMDVSQVPQSAEEHRILTAYNFFLNKMKEDNLSKQLVRISKGGDVSYIDALKLIRDQILNCKVIYVTVKSFDDAYAIFEVLNAKGKDLSAIDIIKNSLFSVLTSTEPIDDADEKWKCIRKNVTQGEDDDFLTFYRHFWLSKYTLTTNKKLVKEFDKRISRNRDEYQRFLNSLKTASEDYALIINPRKDDWNRPEERQVYDLLQALSIFGIKQVRTFLLALFDIKRRKLISHKNYINIVKFLEYFHFVFNAVCSARSSGLERKYSRFARQLREVTNKNDSALCINELKLSLKQTLPSYEEFEQCFLKIAYTERDSKDKKIVQYILKKIETYVANSDELAFNSFTIEHILPESTRLPYVGQLGNLLPLGDTLNSELGERDFSEKIKKYKESSYETVKSFVNKYSNKNSWQKEDIEIRTKLMAKCMYEQSNRMND